MRSAGIVLIVSGVFLIAAVVHSKVLSPSSSSSPSSTGASSNNQLVGHFPVQLPGGGEVNVNASDAAAAIENVRVETGQTGFIA